jgi:restriction endonuclease S subunit
MEKNLWGREILPDVYYTLCFNMLAHSLEKSLVNIGRGDTITDKLWHNTVLGKIDCIGANPPFGMSINNHPSDYPIKNIKDSMCLFIQHIYLALKPNGRAGIVIDKGILTNGLDSKNSWQRKLRKHLLDNTNLYKIIHLPKRIFKHSVFDTSVIFIKKGEATQEVEFIEGYFKKEDKGKGEKQLYFENGIKIKIDAIIKKNYSLKLEDYTNKKEEIINGYIKLGDICDLKKGKPITMDKLKDGDYIVVSAGKEPMGKHSEYNRIENTIIMSCSGANAGWISKYPTKIWAADCFSIQINDTYKDRFINEYLYYFLKLNQFIFIKHEKDNGYQKGNAQPHVYAVDVSNFSIPHISTESQIEIIKFLDDIYKTIKIENTVRYMKEYKVFSILLNRNYDEFRKIIWYQDEIPKLESQLNNIPQQRNWHISSLFTKYRNQCEIKKFGDIVKFNIGGTPSTSEQKYWNGDKLWVSVGELNNNIINDTNKKITNEGISKSSVKLIEKDSILVSFKLSIGKVGIAGQNMYCNEAIMFFKHDNDITNNFLLLYFGNVNFSKGLTNGGIGPGSLNKTSLYNLEIPIPPLLIQQQIITEIKEITSLQFTYSKYADALQEQINNIYTIIDNITKIPLQKEDTEDNFVEYNINDIFDFTNFGKNIETINKTIDKKKNCTIPYYTSNGMGYCNESAYEGKHILCTRMNKNIGTLYFTDNGKFSASNDMLLMKLKDDFDDKFDEICEFMTNNFDCSEIMKNTPLTVKSNGKVVQVTYLHKMHFGNFVIRLKSIIFCG